MPLIADRVRETTTTTGTGTVDLAGAPAGFQTFVSGIGTGNKCFYCITNGVDWEVGIGTVTDASPDTLSRQTVVASSNGGSLVSFAAGSKDVFVTLPASPPPVFARYSSDAGQTVSGDTNLNFEDVDSDVYSCVTTGAGWKFTAPVAGVYDVKFAFVLGTASTLGTQATFTNALYKNGSRHSLISQLRVEVGATSLGWVGDGSTSVKLAVGDFISVHCDASESEPLYAVGTENWISITLLPGR